MIKQHGDPGVSLERERERERERKALFYATPNRCTVAGKKFGIWRQLPWAARAAWEPSQKKQPVSSEVRRRPLRRLAPEGARPMKKSRGEGPIFQEGRFGENSKKKNTKPLKMRHS